VPNDWNTKIIEEFRANAGRVGGPFEGAPMVLLTSTGARSGRPHTTPLVPLVEGARVYVFASMGGAPKHPAWYFNLLANPDVTVERGTEKYAAKAAVVGMTKAVAREWAPFMVNCNAVAPGIIDTRMTAARNDSKDGAALGIPAQVRDQIIRKIPLGRIGTPDDVANAIVFFASPASDFITGEVLEIHGGLEFINVVG